MPIETEIKLRLASLPDATALLERLAYRPQGPRVLQVDRLYDDPEGRLLESGSALRLRSAGERWTLTYKGPPGNGVHKSREEIELNIDDGSAMEQILLALGYREGFRQEKFRTTFSRKGEPGIVTLDETPIGVFLEVEGPAEWIDRTTQELGFLRTDYVVSSYPSLYDEYRKQYPEAPSNMLFSKIR